jgi:Flp pilus assembly protein TadD
MEHKRARALEKTGWRLFEAGSWRNAGLVFDKLLQIEPASECGLQGRIACYRKLREIENAGTLIERALDLHPSSVGILSERAWLNLEQKKYGEAIDAFDAILRNHKKDPELFSWKISLLRLVRRFDEAEKTLDEASMLFQGNYSLMIDRGWLHFYQNQFEEAESVFEEVLKTYKDNEIALQGKIACLRMRGDFPAAKTEAERATIKVGRRPGILSEMAWLNYEQDRYEEAETIFEEVVALTPDDPYAHINLASSLVKQGGANALDSASKECRHAILLDPNLPEARGCMGLIAFKQGRLAEAEAQLRRSIVGDGREGHYADLGALYIQMGRYDEAEMVLKRGLTAKHEDGPLHLELGNLYLQTERPRHAIGEFRQAIALDPRDPDPVRALAITLMEDGKMVEAESILRNAIHSFDESKRWRLHLALCQLLTRLADETGDSELCGEALKEATAALRIAGNHSDPYFFCGIVRFKLEDYRGALNSFRRCQKLDQARVDAEINARRVQVLIRRDRIRSRTSLITSIILCVIILAQLVLLWWWRVKYGVDENAVITQVMITVLVPICLGLVVVSILLPSLTKLKLTGLEAELNQPTAKETLASGPKGEIGFDSGSLNVSGARTGHTVSRPR